MRINQKADLQLQSETGTLIEFTDAYHYNDLQDNLMSVGIACDAGLIMIFDKKKLCVYQETNFKVSGNLISSVKRDASSGLYYWKLFSHERISKSNAYAARARDFTRRHRQNPSSTSISALRQAFSDLQPICARANAAQGKDRVFRAVDLSGPISADRIAALSKSYEQELSKYELYHGRLGHLSTKTIELVYNVKLPPKTGCIECVHGKGHHVNPKEIKKSEFTDRNLKAGEICSKSTSADHSLVQSVAIHTAKTIFAEPLATPMFFHHLTNSRTTRTFLNCMLPREVNLAIACASSRQTMARFTPESAAEPC